MIGVALPLAFATSGSSLHWIGTYRGTISPIRLDGSALRKSRAVGNDRGHIDPVRNGDAFETTGYCDHFDRREGHDKVL